MDWACRFHWDLFWSGSSRIHCHQARGRYLVQVAQQTCVEPPGSIFGPVWTTLYVLMGIAAWLVWKREGFWPAKTALILFAIQLVLNGAWSWIFFRMRRPDLAFLEILFLWIAIAATTLAFFRHSQLAGWLLTPYLAWVSFAAVLNFTIWRMNT